jgi:hypothetical protein
MPPDKDYRDHWVQLSVREYEENLVLGLLLVLDDSIVDLPVLCVFGPWT